MRESLPLLQARFPLFIVSNCQEGYIENFLAFSGLGAFFPDFECSGRTGRDKWANIRSVAERNGLQTPVYVGDTIWDAEAAAGAEAPFVFAAYGFGRVERPAATISAFSELLALFAGDDPLPLP